jgi:hypothetical protein
MWAMFSELSSTEVFRIGASPCLDPGARAVDGDFGEEVEGERPLMVFPDQSLLGPGLQNATKIG